MLALKSLLIASTMSAAGDTQLLYFTASWCQPCRLMEPTIHRLKSAGYPIRTIDMDQEKQTAARFRVRSVPAFVLVRNGQVVQRVDQAMAYDALLQMMQRAGVGPKTLVRGQSPGALNAFSSALGNLTRPNSKPPAARPSRAAAGAAHASPRSRSPQRALAATANPILTRAKAATVRLRIEDAQGQSFGTGTVIDAHGQEVLVLTCGHIFRDSKGKGKISVDTFDARGSHTVTGKLISYDLKKDVALVSLRPRVRITPVPVSSDMSAIREGVAVFSVGCNQGADPTIMQGRIKSINRYQGPGNFVVSGQPIDGRSGGGLFSSEGKLIGVCNAADPPADEGIYASLPVVHQSLKANGLAFVYHRGGSKATAPPAQLALADNRRQPRGVQPLVEQTSLEKDSFAPGAAPAALQPGNGNADTELVVVIRSRRNPSARSKVLVLDQPSPGLLNRLTEEAQR